mgnify:CR=1 FL=1
MINIQPIIMGININQFENSTFSLNNINANIVTKNGEDAVLYVWYDNEFGYTKQVIRLAKQIAKVRRLTYY